MKAFTCLYTALDETNKTNEKVAALKSYFQNASAADAAWAVFFLTGRKPRQVVPTAKLVEWCIEAAEIPPWLFNESYDAVGDLAETMALLLPATLKVSERPLKEWVTERLLPLRNAPEDMQRSTIIAAWDEMSEAQRFIWNKLITGAFRVGVSQQLVIKALSQTSGVDAATIAHRMMGSWEPTPQFFERLIATETKDSDLSRPYPFCLAYPLDHPPGELLGAVEDWQAEWKWDGIRAQLIRRQGQTFIWSRGEDLITDRFPELEEESKLLPDGTVLDGEILPWKEANVMPFAMLQQRIGRKNVGKRMLQDVPVILMAYDLLELNSTDIRDQPMATRRELMVKLLMGIETNLNSNRSSQLDLLGESCDTNKEQTVLPIVPCQRLSTRLRISPTVEARSWEELTHSRENARSLNVEGLMLKRLDSPYKVGRQRGDWWKWKVNPFTIDAVLIYAQRGSGKRASLYTDYTFGVWDQGKLVPIAKAYSGLTDEEIAAVDLFVRQNTLEKFGPVRTVKPKLVFELAFEGIQKSTRHKSGIAVRFPRMSRWRKDKPAEEADTLDIIKEML